MQQDLSAFTGKRILIIGDVMLDEFVWGDVHRISPEAPVPVVRVARRTYAPGGAGNVASNIVGLGGRAVLGGVVGDDPQGQRLRQRLVEEQVGVEGLLVDTERPTITKTRILARGQQVVRIDVEERTALSGAREAAFLTWAEAAIQEADGCVLSDYNKGLFTPALTQRLLALAQEAGTPVVVDPKGKDYARYSGATVVTPNVHEITEASAVAVEGLDGLAEAVEVLQGVLGDAALLVTRGAEGMSLFAPEAEPLHIAATAREVYDVTGAGDTVVGTLVLALAAGWDLGDAARLANQAAGIVVAKVGTATVTQAELRAVQPFSKKAE